MHPSLSLRWLLTGEEGYLADEQPRVGKVELAAEDLGCVGAQWEGDGPGGGVLQIFQGHGQGEGRRPGLQEPALEKTFDFAEDTDALRVAVVAVDLWVKK